MRASGRAGAAGFTLLELLVVVMIISIVAVLAIPTMLAAMAEKDAYNDASAIGELIREARTRAMSRGAAQLVTLTQNGGYNGSDHGTYQIWEAQVPPGAISQLGAPGTPMNTCGPPTVWPTMAGTQTTGASIVDGVNLNGLRETNEHIYSTISDPTTNNIPVAWLCFTPLGRVYYTQGPTPVFVTGQVMSGVLQINVLHTDSSGTPYGIARTVIVPPSGATRIISK